MRPVTTASGYTCQGMGTCWHSGPLPGIRWRCSTRPTSCAENDRPHIVKHCSPFVCSCIRMLLLSRNALLDIDSRVANRCVAPTCARATTASQIVAAPCLAHMYAHHIDTNSDGEDELHTGQPTHLTRRTSLSNGASGDRFGRKSVMPAWRDQAESVTALLNLHGPEHI